MINSQAYEAALKNAAYYIQPNAGFLRFSGDDRIDFLQRQTTNDLRLLEAERTVSTVLTSPTARILDVFLVIDEGETLGVISLPGRSNETLTFLRKRIFFSDQVSINSFSAEYTQILLLGPELDATLQNLKLSAPELNHLTNGKFRDQPVTLLAQNTLSTFGYLLLVSTSAVDTVIAKLQEIKVTPISSEIFEVLRVEAGQPGPVSELTDEYTPLEVNLNEMISDSKGCYTGQEIIARQITYDKVTKNLVGVELSHPVSMGAKIDIDGKAAGIITSVVQSPRFGLIGLALVRRQYQKTGTALSILPEVGPNVAGKIVDLPFR